MDAINSIVLCFFFKFHINFLQYLILLGIIVVIQIILGISAAVHKVNQKDVDNQLKESMIDYSNDTKFWDDMQTNVNILIMCNFCLD